VILLFFNLDFFIFEIASAEFIPHIFKTEIVSLTLTMTKCAGPRNDNLLLYIQIPYFVGVLLYEQAAGFNFVAHKRRENFVGLNCIF